MRLGDLDALKKKIDEVQYTQEFCIEHQIDYSISMQMLGMIIDNAPTVEPKKEIVPVCKVTFDKEQLQEIVDKKVAEMIERPQGEWIDEGQYAEGYSEHAYACKKCGYHIIENPNMIYENRFCKYCGAEMKGGKEE